LRQAEKRGLSTKHAGKGKLMEVDEIRDYCLAMEDVSEGFPFGPSALVFKTRGKMFLLMMLEDVPVSINLKCDPEKALELREAYSFVLPGYHMNKKHWNTVVLEPGLSNELLREWIDHSYDLVRGKKRQATSTSPKPPHRKK
jgi:predicted DNA-binding protein (MmcQ/YjbR family)